MWLRPNEAAAYLRISPKTLYARARADETFRACRSKGGLYARARLDAWVELEKAPRPRLPRLPKLHEQEEKFDRDFRRAKYEAPQDAAPNYKRAEVLDYIEALTDTAGLIEQTPDQRRIALNKRIAFLLKYRRIALGLPLEELANLLSLPLAEVQAYEEGTIIIPASYIGEATLYLGANADSFFALNPIEALEGVDLFGYKTLLTKVEELLVATHSLLLSRLNWEQAQKSS